MKEWAMFAGRFCVSIRSMTRGFARFAAGTVVGLMLTGTATSGTAELSWTAPTQNTDGTPLTDLSTFDVYMGCLQSGQYELPPIQDIPASITSVTASALPEGGTCYFVATATNASGQESVYSNEASKFIAATGELPGVVENLDITWQESSTCASVDFRSNLQSFGGDISNNVTVLENGTKVELADNTWQMTVATFDIVADTILTFDFEVIAQGELHGIGFDTDGTYSSNRMFLLFGTQGSGTMFNDYKYTSPGIQRFQIPVGQYYVGNSMHMILMNDDDAGAQSRSRFFNVCVN